MTDSISRCFLVLALAFSLSAPSEGAIRPRFSCRTLLVATAVAAAGLYLAVPKLDEYRAHQQVETVETRVLQPGDWATLTDADYFHSALSTVWRHSSTKSWYLGGSGPNAVQAWRYVYDEQMMQIFYLALAQGDVDSAGKITEKLKQLGISLNLTLNPTKADVQPLLDRYAAANPDDEAARYLNSFHEQRELASLLSIAARYSTLRPRSQKLAEVCEPAINDARWRRIELFPTTRSHFELVLDEKRLEYLKSIPRTEVWKFNPVIDLESLNKHRTEAGLPPLQYSAELSDVARQQATPLAIGGAYNYPGVVVSGWKVSLTGQRFYYGTVKEPTIAPRELWQLLKESGLKGQEAYSSEAVSEVGYHYEQGVLFYLFR